MSYYILDCSLGTHTTSMFVHEKLDNVGRVMYTHWFDLARGFPTAQAAHDFAKQQKGIERYVVLSDEGNYYV